MKAIFSLIVSLPVLIIVWLTYNRIGAFIFAGGSDSVLQVVRTPLWISALISFVLVISLIYSIYSIEWNIGQRAFLSILFIAWILNGQTIGVYPDGRIMIGWYFFPINITNTLKPNENPEQYVSIISVKTKNFFTLEFKNENDLTTIFVNPWLQSPLMKILIGLGFNSQKNHKHK